MFPSEVERMARFRRPQDARAHGLARMLARYILGLGPADGPFSLTDLGKPHHRHAPAISISHAGGFVAVAVAAQGEIGVDIESRPQDWNPMGLIDRVCHPSEIKWLAMLSQEQRMDGFMAIWTRKEALLKAEGRGLIDDLQSIDTGPAVLWQYHVGSANLALWSLPSKDIACAVAVSRAVERITLMQAGFPKVDCDQTPEP